MLNNDINQFNPYIQKNYFPIDGKETISEFTDTLSEPLDQLDAFKEFSNYIDEDFSFGNKNRTIMHKELLLS